jgi:hypothetical protein
MEGASKVSRSVVGHVLAGLDEGAVRCLIMVDSGDNCPGVSLGFGEVDRGGQLHLEC